MRRFLIGILLLAATTVSAGAAAYTYVDLVKKLTDLEGLAVLPPIGEKCQQASSYDRASKYDPQTDKYTEWGANNDCCGFIREENGKQVWAEIEGPGVIWRIWSAWADMGRVQIYLDGASEPTIDLPFIGYFDRNNEPFIYPSLVHNASGGQNCYVPIPFQKSCKIVAEPNWGQYYHFTYTTYPKDTKLPTFTRSLSTEEKTALAAVDKFLSTKLGTDPAGKREGEKTIAKRISVPAGRRITAAKIEGSGAITAIRVKLNPKAIGDASKTLREVILQISWDGEKEPSVRTPLGDFFGTAPGINEHKSLTCGMSKNGECYSFWYMPFSKSAVVELINDGKKDFPLEINITHAPLTKQVSELGRFHCKWHRDAFLHTEPGREIDWPMLKTDGRGRYCGVMLSVWNPQGGWWGEGDEKFFVDGEKFPSTFGTGSEDYFGYAWCSPALFQNAFHNQTISEGNKGCVSVNRWHITDNIPFQKSIECDIEKYAVGVDNPCKYAATAFFYLAPGQTDPYSTTPSVEERTSYYKLRTIKRVPNAIEAETAKVLSAAQGTTPAVQQMYEWDAEGNLWSGEAQIWWAWPKLGDKLSFALPVKKNGKYELKVQMTKAGDYGIVQIWLDDKKIGSPIDLYNPGVVPTGEISLGKVNLSAGQHKITFEVVGKNEASAAYVIGIDYIKLEAAK